MYVHDLTTNNTTPQNTSQTPHALPHTGFKQGLLTSAIVVHKSHFCRDSFSVVTLLASQSAKSQSSYECQTSMLWAQGLSIAVRSRSARSSQAAASSRQCTTDDLSDLEAVSERMEPVELLAAAKELQGRSVLPFSADSGEGAQRLSFQSSGVLTVLFFIALFSCYAECIAIWTAATSAAGQSCSAQEDEGHLHRRGNQTMVGYSDLGAPAATLQWEVNGSADRVSQGGGEEGSRQHRVHVAPCCRGFRQDRGSESAQGYRQGDHLPSPDKAAHRVSSAGAYACAVSSSKAVVAPGLGSCRRGHSCVRPLLCHPSRSLLFFSADPFPVQAPKDSLSASLRSRDVGQRGGGRAAGEALAQPSPRSTVSAFSQKGEAQEMIALDDLIPDCRLTAGVLFRAAYMHDPRCLPSSAQVSARKGTPAGLLVAFHSFPKAHDYDSVYHAHVVADETFVLSAVFSVQRPTSAAGRAHRSRRFVEDVVFQLSVCMLATHDVTVWLLASRSIRVRREVTVASGREKAQPFRKKTSIHAHDGGIIAIFKATPAGQSWMQLKEKIREKLPSTVGNWFASEVSEGSSFVAVALFEIDAAFFERLSITLEVKFSSARLHRVMRWVSV